jgi:hypothetical protein
VQNSHTDTQVVPSTQQVLKVVGMPTAHDRTDSALPLLDRPAVEQARRPPEPGPSAHPPEKSPPQATSRWGAVRAYAQTVGEQARTAEKLEVPARFGDASDYWRFYNRVAEKHDGEMIKGWNSQLDVLLIFVGLAPLLARYALTREPCRLVFSRPSTLHLSSSLYPT